MEDGDVAVAATPGRRTAHVAAQVVVDGQREEVRLVALRAQQIPDAPGAVADRVALVRGRHPLV